MPLWDKDNSWSFSLLEKVEEEIDEVAINEIGLSVFPNQIEIITSEQMMDAYTSVGLPIMYNHWSFGKHFSQTAESYKRGAMGLAYEIVINSNPCISYLMEENTMTMQALVIAHAAYGHNSFFKNNYLFKQWTDPDFIVDYLLYAKKYIARCEEKHGLDEVEATLDAIHSLMDYGVDKYPRPQELSKEKKRLRELERQEHARMNQYELESTIPVKEEKLTLDLKRFIDEPEENILFFIEKHSPILEDWQRELIRICRKVAQYLYPQGLTKVSNEGFASFMHYTIMNRLYDKDVISEGAMLETLHSHSGVLYQPPWTSKYYSGINPYALGFNIYSDIRRMCENPDEEDKRLFPDVCGQDWKEQAKFAMENFKDESFIMQYLSPKVMKKMRLFGLADYNKENYEITNIHNDEGYREIKKALSRQNGILFNKPEVEVLDYKEKEDRCLHLKHTEHFNVPLGGDIEQVMKNIVKLWGFKVKIYSYAADGETISKTYTESN